MIKYGKARGSVRVTKEAKRALDGVEEILVRNAAGLADDLAAETAPATRAAGEGAVGGDLQSLFAPPLRVAALLSGEPRKAGAWSEAIRKGAGAGRLQKILKGTVLAGVPVVNAPDEQTHKAFMRSGGRRERLPRAIIRREEALAKFASERKRRVWTARRGWSEAAADLGGGSKPWGVSSSRPAGRGLVKRNGLSVRVEITNLVPYARFLMTRGKRGSRIRKWKKKIQTELAEKFGGTF